MLFYIQTIRYSSISPTKLNHQRPPLIHQTMGIVQCGSKECLTLLIDALEIAVLEHT